MFEYDHLRGIPFSHGWNDCFQLIRSFYYDNFGIELTNYARPEKWWEHGFNLYMDYLEAEGFRVLENDSTRNMKPGDLILIAIRSRVPNHAAINLGDGNILHHFYNRRSEVTSYKGMWRNNTLTVARHPEVKNHQPEKKQIDVREYIPAHKLRMMPDVPE